MDSNVPRPGTAPDGLAAQDAPPREHGAGPAGVTVPVGLGRVRWLVAVAGLVAGLAAFGIGEATSELVPPETVQLKVQGGTSTSISRSTPRVVTRGGALAFGILGVCLGGCLGIAGGLARRSASAAIVWGLFGAVLGLALGAGLSFAAFALYYWADEHYMLDEMVKSIVLHSLIWAPLGAAAGLALAFGLGERRLGGRTLAAGLLGALLGAVAFDLVAAIVFPMARTADPVAETWLVRLTARLLVSLATALLVILNLPGPRFSRSAPNPAPHPSSVG